jgi:hypothetical protein
MGDVIDGPGYSLKIPAPLGSADTPGVIRILRFADRLQVLVDDVPLVPGPPDIGGELPLSLSCSLDTDAVIHRISIDLPSRRESTWIDKLQKSWSSRTGGLSPGP